MVSSLQADGGGIGWAGNLKIDGIAKSSTCCGAVGRELLDVPFTAPAFATHLQESKR